MRYLKFERNFSLSSAHSHSLLTHSGFIASRPRKIITKSASSWIAITIDTLMSALSGARTRLSTQIYIWAGTSGSPGQGQGFSSVTMAQECPYRVPQRKKSSVPNVAAKRLVVKRSRFASPTSAACYAFNLDTIIICYLLHSSLNSAVTCDKKA